MKLSRRALFGLPFAVKAALSGKPAAAKPPLTKRTGFMPHAPLMLDGIHIVADPFCPPGTAYLITGMDGKEMAIVSTETRR